MLRCCNRRTAILTIVSSLLTRTATAQSRPVVSGWLTIPLDQWQGLSITHQGQVVHLPARDIFAALQEV